MAAVDKTQDGIGAPAVSGFSITPHATDELAYVTRAVWVGGAGNLDVVFPDNTAVTLAGVTAGTLIPIRVKRVVNTSTATLIVGLT